MKATPLIPDALWRKKPPPSLAHQRATAAARKNKRKDGQGSEDEESGDEETPFFSNLENSKSDSSSSSTTAFLTSSSAVSDLLPSSVELPPPSLPLINQPSLIRTDTSSASTSDHYDNTQTQYYSGATEHDPPLPTVHEINPPAVNPTEDQALDEAAVSL